MHSHDSNLSAELSPNLTVPVASSVAEVLAGLPLIDHCAKFDGSILLCPRWHFITGHIMECAQTPPKG